jgi:Asp-tRNA(Asn)/Glu-tRNA(Gln) amidotransferase A subunit family amidase
MGLTSRDGIVPLYLDHDIGGPMARTVADAVAVLDVIAGFDEADPVTASGREHRAPSYLQYLDAGALRGARLGVMRQWSDREGADAEVLERFAEALTDLEGAGAVIIDPVTIPEIDALRESGLWCPRFSGVGAEGDLEEARFATQVRIRAAPGVIWCSHARSYPYPLLRSRRAALDGDYRTPVTTAADGDHH